MTTQWLQVMLDEIARKRSEAEQAEAETLRRRRDHEQDTRARPGPETRHAEDRRQGQDRRHAARSGEDAAPGSGHERDPTPG